MARHCFPLNELIMAQEMEGRFNWCWWVGGIEALLVAATSLLEERGTSFLTACEVTDLWWIKLGKGECVMYRVFKNNTPIESLPDPSPRFTSVVVSWIRSSLSVRSTCLFLRKMDLGTMSDPEIGYWWLLNHSTTVCTVTHSRWDSC